MIALLGLPDLRPVSAILEGMVRGVTQSQVPAESFGGYHLVPRAANGVRRKLAALLLSDSPDYRAIAARLLAAIQEQRLEYGQPLEEALHPDVTLISQLDGPWALRE